MASGEYISKYKPEDYKDSISIQIDDKLDEFERFMAFSEGSPQKTEVKRVINYYVEKIGQDSKIGLLIKGARQLKRPQHVDKMARAIKVFPFKKVLGGAVSIQKRFMAEFKDRKGREKSFIFWFFEDGTKKRYTKKGSYRGKLPRLEFMRQAYESNREEAKREINNKIIEVIEKVRL